MEGRAASFESPFYSILLGYILPGYQHNRIPEYQDTFIPGYQDTWIPGYQDTMILGY